MKVFFDIEKKELNRWQTVSDSKTLINYLKAEKIKELNLCDDSYDILLWLYKSVRTNKGFTIPKIIKFHDVSFLNGLQMAKLLTKTKQYYYNNRTKIEYCKKEIKKDD